MHSLYWSSVVSLLLVSTLPAQTRTIAERLGHPADSKLLIIHADDLGVAHSVNAASLDALDKGTISSVSAMVPTPWIAEVAAYARTHPNGCKFRLRAKSFESFGFMRGQGISHHSLGR